MALWTQDQAIAFETARECITDMMGICSGQLAQERAKTVPDEKVVAEILAERTRLSQERDRLRVLDDACVARATEFYGRAVREWRQGQVSASE
ncbi:MAG TPA: hypothetical protein VFY31_08840 [Macromonas sp.]|nr:hypothetical protein [Macromonas sp.]